ncbi:N-acetyltransferase family protein [Micromonospora sp. NPDC000018]|uniref:GNAT family N-acetyltransferase n=1 Tax=Micromonospora sp. NPDC000018 TaxID=3154239 RepID=UPI00332E9575
MNAELRPGREDDLWQLLGIYNHHVRHGYATFDESEATLSDRRAWFAAYSKTGPHRLLVAADGDRVVGYATSSSYRPHPAFKHTVETSIYLAPDATGQGLGGRLYDALLAALAGTTAERVVAAVALPNDASVALHLSRGFSIVGTFTDYAVKNGRHISSTWFERPVLP